MPPQPPVPRPLSPVEAMLGQVTVDRDGLPPGSPVGSFVLLEVMERDDFSLLYRAGSSASGSEVVIEEYWPSTLAHRNAEGELLVREESATPLFAAGLEAFVEEAQQLAALDHPALVRMGPVWRLRRTAYRLRLEHPGLRLTEHLDSLEAPPDERWLRALLDPMLGALECVHASGRGHGLVRPDRIVLQADGAPLLLGFGAARAAVARLASWRVERLEPNFAAPEMALNRELPTAAADLYSLAAVLRFCMLGEPPAPVRPGARHESLGLALSLIDIERRYPALRYSEPFVAAIERALSADPAQRPQSVAEFRADLARPATPVPQPEPEPTRAIAELSPAGRASAVDEDGREPLWQLPDLTDLDHLPTLTDEPGLMRAVAPAQDAASELWMEPPGAAGAAAVVRPARRWPWALGGAALGAIAMLVFGLGVAQVAEDLRMARVVMSASLPTLSEVPSAPASSPAPGAGVPVPPVPSVTGRVAGSVSGAASGTVRAAATVSAGVAAGAVGGGVEARSRTPVAPAASITPRPPSEPVAQADKPARPPAARKPGEVATGPAEACAPRTNFSLYLCMKTQCQQASLYTHPQCVQLRRDDES